MIRVFFADDHPMMREGLKYMLGKAPDIEIAGEAENGFEVLAAVRKLSIDILILDLHMPGRHGLELIAQIKSEAPKLPILVWSGLSAHQYALRAMRAGARGYVNKDRAPGQLLDAIRRVAGGQHWIDPEVAELLAQSLLDRDSLVPHAQLSPREHEVFSLLIEGKSVSEIARALFLSSKTISTHKTRMMQKMHMRSISELVQYAVAQNLIEC